MRFRMFVRAFNSLFELGNVFFNFRNDFYVQASSSDLYFDLRSTCAGDSRSPVDLPDGAVVHACKGGNMTLPWSVTLGSGETINDIKWFYDGRSRELMAMFTSGSFFAMPAFSQRVQHEGNAGIVLSHVTTSDAGNYSVEVVAHEAQDVEGKLSTFHRMAVVDVVTDLSMSSDVSLHVRQELVAVYDQSTGEWLVALTCGTLTNWGHRPADVIWTTPSGTTLSSTSYADGEFRLLLPNPVTGGTYTCHLPHDSPAATCLPKDSPILTPAAVDVDRMEARFSLLEAEQRALRVENDKLHTENVNLTSYVRRLESTLQNNANLENKMREMEENVTGRLMRLLSQATRHVSFHAELSTATHVGDGYTIIPDHVFSNDGGAYNGSTGYFTAPYAGTYFFTATASPADSSHVASLYIKVEEGLYSAVVSYLESDEDSSNMGSCQAVVHLTAGQRVWLDSAAHINYFYGRTTTFSGFLINAD